MGCGGSKADAPAAAPPAAAAPAPAPAASAPKEDNSVTAINIPAGEADERPLNSPGKGGDATNLKASEMTDADWEAQSGKEAASRGPTKTGLKKGEGAISQAAAAVSMPGAVNATGEDVAASKDFRAQIAEAKQAGGGGGVEFELVEK